VQVRRMRIDRLPAPARLALLGSAAAVLLWLCLAPSRDLPRVNLWDKAEHAGAWAVLAGLGVALFPRRPGRIAGFALALGAAVEVLQGLLPFGRDADWRDLVGDAAGIAFALLVAALARRAFARP